MAFCSSRKRSSVPSAIVLGVAIVGALISSIAIVFTAAFGASADAGNTNKLAGLEKSMVLLWTRWTGRIEVPADAFGDHAASYTKDVSYYETCTGWYVSKTAQIVTAGHCVDPEYGREVVLKAFLKENNATNLLNEALADWHVEGATQGSPIDRSVEATQPGGVEGATITTPTTVQVVDFKPTNNGDVALLQVPNMAKETPPLTPATAAPQIGEPVTSIGFPGELRAVADQSQIARASFKTGSVSSHQVTAQGVTKIEVSAALAPGMSGGPTVNGDGQVVGVNSTALPDAANFNFITGTVDLRAFLVSHDVALVPSSAPRAGIGLLWSAICGIGVLVLALGATTLLLIRRRRHPQDVKVKDGGSDSSHRMEGAAPIPGSVASPANGAVRNGARPTLASEGNTEPARGDTLTAATRCCSACGAKTPPQRPVLQRMRTAHNLSGSDNSD